MRVTVRLFARLRDIAGASELARDVAPGTTIRAVWRQLAREYPAFAEYERSISAAGIGRVNRNEERKGRKGRNVQRVRCPYRFVGTRSDTQVVDRGARGLR